MPVDDRCPSCLVDLEDTRTSVRCWRCGWEVHDTDDGPRYKELSDAIAEREAWLDGQRWSY
jgi:hypothetical protein